MTNSATETALFSFICADESAVREVREAVSAQDAAEGYIADGDWPQGGRVSVLVGLVSEMDFSDEDEGDTDPERFGDFVAAETVWVEIPADSIVGY